jgi:germination protein M
MKSRVASLAMLLSIALVTAACQTSGSLGTVPPLEPTPEPSLGLSPPDSTPEPTLPPASAPPAGSPLASPGPTPAPEGTSIVRAYFILGGEPGVEGLVPYLFEVPKTPAVATAAMTSLLTGSPVQRDGYAPISSAIPAGTKLLGLSIKDGVATVDLSGEFATGGGSASSMYRLAQVVYTLTQFPTVSSVLFKVDGTIVTVFGSEGIVLDGPVRRSIGEDQRFEDQLPAIFVDRPASGAAIGNPARISGNSNEFEATSWVTLLDGAGRVIAHEVTTATCGTGCRGTFDQTIPYNVSRAQWGTLRVEGESAADGSPHNVREYPVWLTPAG